MQPNLVLSPEGRYCINNQFLHFVPQFLLSDGGIFLLTCQIKRNRRTVICYCKLEEMKVQSKVNKLPCGMNLYKEKIH